MDREVRGGRAVLLHCVHGALSFRGLGSEGVEIAIHFLSGFLHETVTRGEVRGGSLPAPEKGLLLRASVSGGC